MKIKGAIFDMDGTLLDSMKYWDTVGIEYLKRLGIEFNNERDNYVLNVGIRKFCDFCNKTYGLNKTYDEVLKELHNIIEEKYDTIVELKPGALNMLKKFKQNGVKMCLATATELYSAKKVLTRLGIIDYFSDIITTTMVGKDKNSPLIYRVALERLGTDKSETYVFEDAYYAICTAQKDGFNIVGIEDKYTAVPSEEIAPLCDHFLYAQDEYNTWFLE